ncbi:MAG: rRNA pseudouridine synthase [Clostridiales bacterium]|jgi:pseudouridine synthase|nr:rRNA pseudouridine synthase [Clostridiales bacterium]
MLVRLQKYLADAGVASRRGAEALMREGRVSVNGSAATVPGTKIDPERDEISLDGHPVKPPRNHFIYLMLHKPEGVITSASDPQGRPVAADFIKTTAPFFSALTKAENRDAQPRLPETDARVFPGGRLDYDTSGLLLLTNDGALTQALTHPRYRIEKVYVAKLRGVPQREALRNFRSGLFIEGRKTAPAKISVENIQDGGSACRARITLREGRNRQVRKMCEAIRCPVLSLKRVAAGPLKLGDLPKGRWRPLTAEEVSALRTITLNHIPE